MVAGRGRFRTNERKGREASQQGDKMSRRNQVLWSAALYATFAAIAVGHIGEGDWGYLLVVVTLAFAASAAFTLALRVRRSQPVPAEASAKAA